MHSLLILMLDKLLTLLEIGLFALCFLLSIETIGFLLPLSRRHPWRQSQHYQPSPEAAIIIPAHNEEVVLAQTLLPLVDLPYPIILVADNCDDGTAAIARELGVVVLERYDEARRGKGYAMDYGLDFLREARPDVVMFLDADCQITPQEVIRVVQYAAQQQQPVQAAYVMQVPPQPSSKDRVSAFAFRFKNQVRMHGLSRMGAPILLTGSGMAFPWHCLEKVSLASGAIVEDMQLGIDLAISGNPVLFYPKSIVTSVLPQQVSAAATQRTRWEHGHLQSIGTYVPRLLVASLRQRRLDLLLLAWDLCVPPLSLMVLAWLGSLAIASVSYSFGIAMTAFWLVIAAGVLLLGSILLAWHRVGRQDLALGDILRIPFYILGKVPLYLKFITSRQQSWERTARDRL